MVIELYQCAAYAVLQEFTDSVTWYLLHAAIGRSLLGTNVDPPSVYGSTLEGRVLKLQLAYFWQDIVARR